MTRSAIIRLIKPPYVWIRRALANALFDRRYGVDTSGDSGAVGLGGSDLVQSRHQQPAGLLSLRRILPPAQILAEDVFIDFGSGKGRVVLQAALQYPFRTVYGVEISEHLHRIAVSNLDAVAERLRCRDVRLVRADALDFDIPDDVTVAFFFNPFGAEVFSTILEKLLESVDRNPRRLRIVYGNPVEEDVLLGSGRARVIRQVRGLRPDREWSRSNSYRLYLVA